jgi:HlyD family secretion protein
MFSKPEPDTLPLLQPDDLLPPISRWMTWGGIALVGTVAASLLVAMSVQFNVIVRAIAEVRPEGELSIVQAGTTGILKSVEAVENQTVAVGDIIAQLDDPDLYRLQSQQQEISAYLMSNQANLEQVQAQINALDNQILQDVGATPVISSPIDEASLEVNIETALAEIAETSLAWAESLFQQRDSLLQRLAAANTAVEFYQRELERVEAEIDKRVILAPVAGTILQLEVRNPGQMVTVGSAIAQIVPHNSALLINSRVAAEDIGQVEVGQSAVLRVSAYPYPDYGVLQGTVVSISPDALPCQGQCFGRSTRYYEVMIRPEQGFLSRGDRQYPLQPGMEVTTDIISRQERLINFILRKVRLQTNL